MTLTSLRDDSRVRQAADLLETVAAFAIPFAIYVRCLTGNPGSWDTAEAQTVPYIAGIFHPTGFPFYAIAGWLFTHIVVVGSVAWRMNLLSACSLAFAALLLRATALRLGAARPAAMAAAILFAVGPVVWFKATRSDVHAFNFLLVAIAFYWSAVAIRERGSNAAIWAALAVGFGLATHPVTLWSIPAVAAAVAFAAWRREARTVVLACAAGIVPLVLYAYLPLRSWIVAHSGVDPVAAPPFFGHGEMLWNVNDPQTLAGFLKEVSGSQFDASARLGAILNLGAYGSYVQYWSHEARTEFGAVFLVLIIALVVRLLRKPDAVAFTLVIAGFAAIPFAVAYSAVEGDVTRYFLASYFVLCALAASVSVIVPTRVRMPLDVLVAVLLLIGAYRLHDEHKGMYAYRYDEGSTATIRAVQTFVPDGAIVVTGWVDAPSLGYAAYIEHAMGSRTILTGWPGEFLDDYPRWAKTGRRIFLYIDQNTERNLPNVPLAWRHEFYGSGVKGHRFVEVIPHHAQAGTGTPQV